MLVWNCGPGWFFKEELQQDEALLLDVKQTKSMVHTFICPKVADYCAAAHYIAFITTNLMCFIFFK